MSQTLRPSTAKMLLDMPPLKAKWRAENRTQPTAAMRFGTDVDAVAFNIERRPSRNEDYESGVQAAANAAVAAIIRLRNRLGADHVETQKHLEWTSRGVACSGTPDVVLYDQNNTPVAVADLKTTRSADHFSAEGTLYRLHYDLQLAAYGEGLGAPLMPAFVVWVESEEPYLSRTTTLKTETLRSGLVKWHRAVDTWRACVESGVWPGFDDNVM